MSYNDESWAKRAFNSLFVLAFAVLFTITAAHPSFSQTSELKKQFIAEHGGSTFRFPNRGIIRSGEVDYIVYIDPNGSTYYLNGSYSKSDANKYFFDKSYKVKFNYRIKKGRVRIVPFRSKNAFGFCFGTRSCFDTKVMNRAKLASGDRYELKKRNAKKTTQLLGLK